MGIEIGVDVGRLQEHARHVAGHADRMAGLAGRSMVERAGPDAFGVVMMPLTLGFGVSQGACTRAITSLAIALEATAAGIAVSTAAYQHVEDAVVTTLERGRALVEGLTR